MRQLTRRQRLAAIVLGVLALCFITLDLGGGSLKEAHTGVRGTLGALYRGTDNVLGPVRRWAQGVPSAGTNESRIRDLEHQVAQLQGELATRAADARTSAQLTRLSGTGHRVQPARVIALGPGQGFDWTVTIDAGTSSGVRVGQTVTDGVGLVGRVLHADDSSAVVLLAADPGSGVGARDTRSGEVGVVTGHGTAGLVFDPLNPNASLRPGDALVTGPGRASSYVAGLSIGTVTAVRRSADGTVVATVRPASSPTQVDIVGVITDDLPVLAGGR